MALPDNIKLIQLERDKFTQSTLIPGEAVIKVANADGSSITGGSNTGGAIYDGSNATIKANVISTASGNALITFPLSGPTIFAVVNTSAAGVGQSLVTINPRTDYIGLMSVSGNVNLQGLVSLASGTQVLTYDQTLTSLASGQFIGLNPSGNWIGLATVNVSNPTILISAPTLFAVVNTGAAGIGQSLVTINNVPLQTQETSLISLASGTEIRSLATIMNWPTTQPVSFNQLVSLASGTYVGIAANSSLPSIQGNVTFTNTTIGLTGLVSLASGTTMGLNASSNFIGLVSTASIQGTVQVSGITPLISLASGTLVGLNPSSNFIGLVSVASINGTVTNAAGTQFIGLVSTASIMGTVTLATGANFIGLATIIPTPISGYTSFATVVSASGNATIFVPPASNRWVLKDLIIGSLGRGEVKIISGTSDVISYIALATTGGYISNFGDSGLPGKAINDSFVVALNGAATISVLANIRFQTT